MQSYNMDILDTLAFSISLIQIPAWFMVFSWLSVILSAIFIAYKTKAWGIMVVSGGAIPFFIFYLYIWLEIWTVGPAARLYSRLAGVSLVVSLLLALWLMYRSVYDGPRQ